MLGTVKASGFNADRGFGFIQGDNNRDYFLHIRNVTDVYLPFDSTLIARRVEFDAQLTDKGPEAVNVRAVEAQGDTA